jgi:hypothetical protein
MEANGFNNDNTILVDDNPEKSFCNDVRNSLFLQMWTRQALKNDIFLHILSPWLFCLHSDCNVGQLRDFINKNRIEVLPLAKDSVFLLHITRGMALSARNIKVQY